MLSARARHVVHEFISLQAFRGAPHPWELGTNGAACARQLSDAAAAAIQQALDPATGDLVLPPSPSPSVPLEDQLLAEIGVLGVPNAGKSTLTNAVVGSKVSAVSDKTNTTTRSRLGAFTSGNTQVVLLDTPGVVGPGQNLGLKHLRRLESAWKTAAQCDLLLFVVDARRQLAFPDPRVVRLVESLGGGALPGLSSSLRLPPVALVLNKVDAVRREEKGLMLPLVDQFRAAATFEEVFWVSALRGLGMDELREYLLSKAVPGKGWAVEAGVATDAGALELACEIVREKIFRAYYKEIPYEIGIVPVSHRELSDGSVRVEAEVRVRSEALRMIVVGRNGAAIGSVGKAARLELENMWKRRVHLFLQVKTEK